MWNPTEPDEQPLDEEIRHDPWWANTVMWVFAVQIGLAVMVAILLLVGFFR